VETILILLLLLCIAASLVVVRRYRRLALEASEGTRASQQEASSWRAACQREEAILRQVLAYAADALIITDSGRRILHYSAGAERLFETPAERALGRPFIEVVRDADLDHLLRSCLSSQTIKAQSVRLPVSQKTLEATAVPFQQDAEGPYALMVMEDVTELRQLETARREFVANISHELRVPLATVKAMVETLQEGALSDTGTAKRFLSQINAEVDNLTQLVRELLELSRIESGQAELHLAPAHINQVVQGAVERLRAQADQRGLEVTMASLPDNPVVVLDEEKVGQVVLNLLHNAIKFTPKGGRIDVRVRAQSEGPSPLVYISVQDTGVGISEEDLPRVFERFYKVDKARKRGEGTGLGLAIAKHIVQAHGGQIWAESMGGKGSTFTFTLPLKLPPQEQA
jgi:two-component system phosphate regulon sensor histidine kinase PhoR